MKAVLTSTLVFGAALAAFAETPKGLADSDWSSIRAAYEAGKHQFFPQEDGSHKARNTGLGWNMSFDGKGFAASPDGAAWSWGLELEGAESGPVSAKGNRLMVQRGEHLEEWFVNDSRGLEQGWTVRQRLDDTAEPLRLSLRVRGGMKPRVSDQSVSFGDGVLTYSGLKAWDAAGRVLPTRFVPEAEKVVIEVDDSGAQYPVTIDPIAQNAYLKASNTGASDGFGNAVAVSSDTVVVGAHRESSNATGINGNQADNSATNAGAAYVFVRSGGNWVQQAYLKASNTQGSDFFGGTVTISGDTIVVGARWEDSNATGINGDQANNGANDSGSAYVFVRSGGNWSQQAYLKASNTGVNDNFGSSVDIFGDTVVVGASLEGSAATGINGNQNDNSAGQAGAAYVFKRSGNSWTQQAYLKASNTNPGDRFGDSVSVSSDTISVGADGESSNATGINGDQTNNTATSAGAVYVFVRNGNKWIQQAYLKASNTNLGDKFGESLSVSGDTIVVGAFRETSNGGAAYVFVRSIASWTQQAYLKASNTAAGDQFGHAVAVSGDALIVTANGESSNATGVNGDQSNNSSLGSGAAYLFIRKGNIWVQQAYLKPSNTGAFDGFGFSAAISGDTIVVGAYGESSNATGINGNQADNSAAGSGAAYLFSIGEVLDSLSKTNQSAAGASDLTFGTSGYGALSPNGQSLFESRVTGAGSTRGRSRAMFSAIGGPVGLALQTGSIVSGFANLPFGAQISSISNPVHNRSANAGVFQATARGLGLNSGNNQLILHDNGAFISPILRTGLPLTELGGALPRRFSEVLQSEGAPNWLAVSYTLKSGTAGVTSTNDSGLLLVDSSGAISNSSLREGQPVIGGGTLGPLGSRMGMVGFDGVAFLAKWIPTIGGSPVDSVFWAVSGPAARTNLFQGNGAAGAGSGVLFRSFTGLTRGGSGFGLARATLSNSPSQANEGVWHETNQLRLRKGQDIGGGLRVTRILRVWGNNSSQVMAQVLLGGTGVNGSNNQALILRQTDGNFFVLLRTGQPAPGIGLEKVTLRTFQAVDVDPLNGHYAVLGSLRGAPASANQALWSGRTKIPGDDDTTLQHLRLPQLRLQKGELYHTEQTPGDVIRSIALKPAVDRTGVGGRGLAQVINSSGQILLTLTGDRRTQELVRLSP